MPSPRMMRSAKVSVPCTFFLMRLISSASASILSALLIETSRRSGEAGFTTKSTAPARIALMAASIEPCAVCTMIGGSPGLPLSLSSTAMPSTPSMTRSRSTRPISAPAGPSRICSACSPELAVLVSNPSRLTVSSRMRRWAGSSSTIRRLLTIWHSNSTSPTLNWRFQVRMLRKRTVGHQQVTQQRRDCPRWVNKALREGSG